MLVALNTFSRHQAQPTQETIDKVNQLLDYAATNPDAVIEYNPSDIILKIHSDASYLSEPRAKSRVGGHKYLGQNDYDTTEN